MTTPVHFHDRHRTRELYRDELNFSEFPLAAVSASLPKDQKTLEFTDEIFDKSTNQRVTRKLTITASDKFGLPTAMDDEVILGLIQLTGRTEFASRRVYFTRYELLKLLSWADTARNYDRLEQSLNRWLGVTLYYDKAWWSKEEASWVNEGFHILDHVQILDRERQRKGAKRGQDGGKSSFVWNDVVFNSFKAGYLKQIDFEFYKELKSAVSKRMYRFLDKRFYHRQRLEFDLRTFACEHIGLSKGYHTGELKRVLGRAIEELEERGFLEKLPSTDRFVRRSKGEWSAVFVRGSESLQNAQDENPSDVVTMLVQRGLKPSSARALSTRHAVEKIQEKVSLFDWLSARKDSRIARNPAGFLYRAIADDFTIPEDFRNAMASERRAERPKVVPLRKPAKTNRTPDEKEGDRTAIDEFWNALPVHEREEIEKTLVKAAPPFFRQQYVDGEEERGVLFHVVRQALIDAFVRKELASRNAPEKVA